MLDFAQIKAGKFRKNIQEFNIVDAIEEVMSIQREQAKLKKVSLTVTYVNLILPSAGDETNWDKEMFSPIIKSDIGRL